MAHELGHMVLDVRPPVAEKAAHQFAAAFLMPREALLQEVGWRRTSIGWCELFRLQRTFGVSARALARRCEAVGVFTATLARLLYSESSRQRWTRPPFEEPVEIPCERPERFERLCFRGLAEGTISTSKAMELLEMTIEELVWHMASPVDHNAEPGFPRAGEVSNPPGPFHTLLHKWSIVRYDSLASHHIATPFIDTDRRAIT